MDKGLKYDIWQVQGKKLYLSLRRLSLKMISNVSPNCVMAAPSPWIPLR